MLDILITVIPVFLVIGAGYLAVRLRVFPQSAVDGLMSFTQGFAVPCLLFVAVAKLDLAEMFDPGLLISFYTGATVAFGIGIAGALYLFRRRPGEAVAVAFGALFSNSTLLGLPIMSRAFGESALAPNFAIISIHAPFCYLLGITAMEMARADGRGALETARAVLRAMFRNALMIGLFLGIATNLSGLPLPEPVWAAIEMVAGSALPAALFGLGGILTRYALRDSIGEAAMISGLSLLVHPTIAWFLGTQVFDLPQGFVNSLVMTAAMAPGVNAYVFANLYDRGKGAAASAVLLATGLSVITASGWLYLLRH
ncbi:AEC family transporter [Oceanicella sp. SM1341]|uniref:AEC family transporter n=1 Tax=Oceanicella sp. SM1341 TaxID=1548889 RepID=UPI000E49DCA5|nr:AEC family transporter [Oceanicella sp. SM1341]